MLKKSVEKALNEQINAELFSAYLYLSMQAYFEGVNLPGCANWMRNQALEEFTHADKFFRFIIERGGRVALQAIDAPETKWDGPQAVFVASAEHEAKVTARINGLVDLAMKEKDHATLNFLQWFVGEQVEEEAAVDQIVQKLKLVKGEGSGLFMIDQELAKRTFTPPAAAAE
ncbi:ferritin [bacterium]|nr:ferritin [bacterium]